MEVWYTQLWLKEYFFANLSSNKKPILHHQ
jgi:hypothetical protein